MTDSGTVITPTIAARQWKRIAARARSNSPAPRDDCEPEVSIGCCDVICRREPGGIGLDTAEAGGECLQRLLHLTSDLGRAHSGKLLDDQDQTGLPLTTESPING
jgi:hypothetical protein